MRFSVSEQFFFLAICSIKLWLNSVSNYRYTSGKIEENADLVADAAREPTSVMISIRNQTSESFGFGV